MKCAVCDRTLLPGSTGTAWRPLNPAAPVDQQRHVCPTCLPTCLAVYRALLAAVPEPDPCSPQCVLAARRHRVTKKGEAHA